MKTISMYVWAVLFAWLGWSSSAQAQTLREKQAILKQTNTQQLQKISQTSVARQLALKQQAYAIAKKKGLPVRYTLSDGRIVDLQSVTTTGDLIYYIEYSNVAAAQTTRTNHLWTGGSMGLDLNGQGMIVGEWDGGAVRVTHQEFATGRVIQRDSAVALSTHATHVAGTLVASGVLANTKGMAHQATLWAHFWDNDEAEMASAAAQGLLISNHSYGYRPDLLPIWMFGFYDSQAAEWDEIVYNAPYYLPVKSAGNDRDTRNLGAGGYDLPTGAGNSKNILCVGSVSAVSNYTGPASVLMSPTSSWGPTDDGRIKPDVVGNGVSVFSSSASSNTAYTTLSGTSMASPNVAGTLLLLQQHYKNLNSGTFMRAATLKGLVIHTTDEAGTTPGPDYRFGWGLVNAQKAADAISGRGTSSVISEQILTNGTTYTQDVVATGEKPLEVTICWTDPKGIPATGGITDPTDLMLINDLDVRVTSGGVTFRPWILDPARRTSGATTGDNFRDNVEKIYIGTLPAGTYTITVSHKGTLANNGQQPFSLIVTGVSTTLNPPLTCIAPGGLTTSGITLTKATLNWGPVPFATSYDVRIRTTNSPTWTEYIGLTATMISLTGLQANGSYEWQIRSNCAFGSSEYSSSILFKAITPSITYCASKGTNPTEEWIQRVQVGTINHTSGSASYSDFTNMSTKLTRGDSVTITIIPAWSGTVYDEGYAVWIDYNKDGDFADAGEQVFIREATIDTSITGSFVVPVSAKIGSTRMRVSLKYDASPLSSCETFNFGEVEDYAILIGGSSFFSDDPAEALEANIQPLHLSPVPASDKLRIEWASAADTPVDLQIIDMSGRLIQKARMTSGLHELDVQHLKPGLYLLRAGKQTQRFVISR